MITWALIIYLGAWNGAIVVPGYSSQEECQKQADMLKHHKQDSGYFSKFWCVEVK